jgi:hypothetical protein
MAKSRNLEVILTMSRLFLFPSGNASRRFLGWRAVYGLVLLALALPFLIGPADPDVGREPGWYLLILGVVPTAVVLALVRSKPGWARRAAFAHDLLLMALFVFLLFALPNYFAFIFLCPLVGFLGEGLIMWAGTRPPSEFPV